jgi:hypothetical protein
MNRRGLLRGSAACLSLSVLPGFAALLASCRAQAQWQEIPFLVVDGAEDAALLGEEAEGVAVAARAPGVASFIDNANGVVNGIQALCDLIRLFHKEDKEQFKQITAKLGSINQKLDVILNNLRSLPATFERILKDQELEKVFNNIRSTESSILEDVRAIQRGGLPEKSNLLNFAGVQQQNRNSLKTGNFGPGVYPYIVRAFASQALAYFTLGNCDAQFKEGKDATLNVLSDDANAFRDFVKTAFRSFKGLKDEWNLNSGQIYLGTHIPKAPWADNIDYYLAVEGSIETGPAPKFKTRKTESDGNALGWKQIPYLHYKGSGYQEDTLIGRRERVIDHLTSLSGKGNKKKEELAYYLGHLKTLLALNTIVGKMEYAQPPVPPPSAAR